MTDSLIYLNISTKNGRKLEGNMTKKYLPQDNLSNYLKLFVGPCLSGFVVKKILSMIEKLREIYFDKQLYQNKYKEQTLPFPLISTT